MIKELKSYICEFDTVPTDDDLIQAIEIAKQHKQDFISIAHNTINEAGYDYDEYLSEFVVNKIENKIKMSKEISAIKHMAEILTPEYVYMEIEGYNLTVKFEISNNIKEIATTA